jgi:enoyl-CoA hydratase
MIRTAWHDRVLVVTIDRPERRNALDHDALDGLLAAQSEASDGGARVVVLTGAGAAFCAGADLTGLEDTGFADLLGSVLRGFGALPAIALAAIDGPALGAGCQLAAACDLRVATPGSRFGIPAAKLGLAIDWWTVQRLASEAGPPVARAMLLAAATYTGEQLHASGFVHRLGGLHEAVLWADDLSALAPLTIAAHKRGLEALETAPPDAEFELARRAAWASHDAAEGRQAFLDKRPPRFQGA